MPMLSELRNSIITITGGTGSFGIAMAKDLLKQEVSEIRILSRDEAKQDAMRKQFSDQRLRFFLGDVRDFDSTSRAIKGSNYVFHAAALKQVPSCEFFPMEAAATNIVGSSNVIESSIQNSVQTVVCLSTDKAVYPINAMGMTKALMEKVAQSYSRLNSNTDTKIKITRYGNVLMSRGSVLPLFISQIQSNNPITITNPDMSRFVMSLSEAVELVKFAFLKGESGDIFVQKAPGCTIGKIADAVITIYGQMHKSEINNIGTRHGEKLYETLVSSEEMAVAIDCGSYFRIPIDSRSLDYGIYFNKGSNTSKSFQELNSSNTIQLSIEQVIDKIKLADQENKSLIDQS
jgi:UDP-N-acetylglucosamine 4,6-dehydratase